MYTKERPQTKKICFFWNASFFYFDGKFDPNIGSTIFDDFKNRLILQIEYDIDKNFSQLETIFTQNEMNELKSKPYRYLKNINNYILQAYTDIIILSEKYRDNVSSNKQDEINRFFTNAGSEPFAIYTKSMYRCRTLHKKGTYEIYDKIKNSETSIKFLSETIKIWNTDEDIQSKNTTKAFNDILKLCTKCFQSSR